MVTSVAEAPQQRPPASKLSRGAKNTSHKTYISNEKRINKALCKNIAKRRSDIDAKEIYTDAGIAPPTFYLHHRSVQEAMLSYETNLEHDLHDHMPDNPKREVVYTVLTSHIARNRIYFIATAKGGDHYLLNRMITFYRVNLVGDKIDDRVFRYYVATAIVAINCWLELDGVNEETTKACCRRLLRIRPMKWE